MSDYLLFRIYGPLASWGDIAVGEHRPSYGHPSKSAIIGLVSGAIGVRRHEEARLRGLAESYGFAVRVDSPGQHMSDYHTVQVPPSDNKRRFHTRRDELSANNLGTILSKRDYRMDACYTVALWPTTQNPPYSMENLASALANPQFVPYFGRKSCSPALPFAPRVVSTNTLREAFDSYPGPDEFLRPILSSSFPVVSYYWEYIQQEKLGMEPLMTYPRRDQPLSRKRWQFGERDEYFRSENIEEVKP